MFIDIRKVAEGNSSAETMLSFSDELRNAGRVVGDFPAKIQIQRFGGFIFITIEYVGEVELECSRCLKTFTKKVWGSVEFTLQSSLEEDVNGGENDVYTYEAEDDIIDFEQSVYDDMMVRVTVKPICESKCTGLEYQIPVETKAELATETVVDARWASLAKLKK